MSKKKIDPRPNKIALMAIAIFCVAVFFGGYFLVRGLTPKEFRLDEEMYDKSEAIDIDKGTYEKLIADKKSFIIMIDKLVVSLTFFQMPADPPGDLMINIFFSSIKIF